MRLSRSLLAGCLACGRLEFDPAAAPQDATGGGADVANTGQLVVSQTPLATSVGFSWVALDVDWDRSLAYVGTREAGRCVAVVDFANEQAPSIVHWLAPGDGTCLDVVLFPDRARLGVLSYATNKVAVWSLGDDPRAGTFTTVAQATVSKPRHFALDLTGANPRFLVAASPQPGLVDLELAGSTLGAVATWAGTCAVNYQAVTMFGANVAIACEVDNAPVEIVTRDGFADVTSIPNLAAGTSGSWIATTLLDGRAVVLGWANMIIDGTTAGARWQTTGGYRDAILGDPPTVWAVKDSGVELMSFTSPGAPRVIGAADLGVGREVYAIRRSTAGTRAIVVTNNGYFMVLDPRNIPAVDFQYPSL